MRCQTFDPSLADREDQRRAAKAALLAKFKPKPTVIVPFSGETREEAKARRMAESKAKRAMRPKTRKGFSLIEYQPCEKFVVVVPTLVVTGKPEPIRYTVAWEGPGPEFKAIVCDLAPTIRRRSAYKAWKLREWHEGNRKCAYCDVKMVLKAKRKDDPHQVTVDHAEPLAEGGDDAAWNWRMCCQECNGRKGRMTEAKYRALLARSLAAE